MALNLSILYRGELSGCNYACGYCPFAKRVDSAEHLRIDRAQIERFVDWVSSRTEDRLKVFFTPWGEALVRRWYQHALVRLSHLPQVRRVAIQTNLSCPLDFVRDANRNPLGLWCTYHPGEVARQSFLDQCRKLDDVGMRYSVGIVGLREHFDEITAMRQALCPRVYLWVNAYKRDPDYYSQADIARLVSIDPLFEINNQYHNSRGKACGAGETSIAVDGKGDFQRCYFIKQRLGNLYQSNWESALQSRSCTNETCGCYIGYANLKELQLETIFGTGLIDRSFHDYDSHKSHLTVNRSIPK